MVHNIVITGVGGQGTLLVAHILAQAANEVGHTVHVGEVHGMAQRGGNVISYVRIGQVYSSLISPGEASLLLGLELGETYRALRYASEETWIVSSIRRIMPITVSTMDVEYPDQKEIIKAIEDLTANFLYVDALELARESGAAIAENIVLLGALLATGILPINLEQVEKIIQQRVPAQWQEANEKALHKGFEEGEKFSKIIDQRR